MSRSMHPPAHYANTLLNKFGPGKVLGMVAVLFLLAAGAFAVVGPDLAAQEEASDAFLRILESKERDTTVDVSLHGGCRSFVRFLPMRAHVVSINGTRYDESGSADQICRSTGGAALRIEAVRATSG